MKQIILLLISAMTAIPGAAQIVAAKDTVVLRLSTPQPRRGEIFEISIGANELSSDIFHLQQDDIGLENERYPDNRLTQKVRATRSGHHDIGPLTFTMNNKRYITNRVSYDVVEPLPQDAGQGLWFRVVKKGTTGFYILIDQRIPGTYITPEKQEHPHPPGVVLNTSYELKGTVAGGGSNSHISTEHTTDGSAYISIFSVYEFYIIDEHAPVIITAAMFEQLPRNYSFRNINVQ